MRFSDVGGALCLFGGLCRIWVAACGNKSCSRARKAMVNEVVAMVGCRGGQLATLHAIYKWKATFRTLHIEFMHNSPGPPFFVGPLQCIIGVFFCFHLFSFVAMPMRLGEFTPSCILHTRACMTYLLGGLFTLLKRF